MRDSKSGTAEMTQNAVFIVQKEVVDSANSNTQISNRHISIKISARSHNFTVILVYIPTMTTRWLNSSSSSLKTSQQRLQRRIYL